MYFQEPSSNSFVGEFYRQKAKTFKAGLKQAKTNATYFDKVMVPLDKDLSKLINIEEDSWTEIIKQTNT